MELKFHMNMYEPIIKTIHINVSGMENRIVPQIIILKSVHTNKIKRFKYIDGCGTGCLTYYHCGLDVTLKIWIQ